jgi:hypothetical protein
MASIKYENEDFPLGEEVFVKDLGTLINGESVEFSDEQVKRFETKKGEGAFKKIAHTDQLDEYLLEPAKAEEAEPTALFPPPVEVPQEPEGSEK